MFKNKLFTIASETRAIYTWQLMNANHVSQTNQESWLYEKGNLKQAIVGQIIWNTKLKIITN